MAFEYPLFLDGGFATELERTFEKNLSGKLWSAQCLQDDPKAIQSVHELYYKAGANIATTCSYQTSVQGFLDAGYTKEHAVELMNRSIELAIKARDEFKKEHPHDTQQRLVALSIGCYGAVLANGSEYTGDYNDMTVDQLVEFHKSRLNIFFSKESAKRGIDMIIFETIPSFLEAQAIQKLLSGSKELYPPVAVAFQCRSEDQIADGTAICNALELFNEIDAVFALGINCTKPKFVESLFATVAKFNQESGKDKALIAYPDGGEEWNAVARSWDTTCRLPEEAFGCMMAQCIKKYGPKVVVGGCCGTSPSHIRNILEMA